MNFRGYFGFLFDSRGKNDPYLIVMAYFWAVWLTHGLLRFFHLVRNDAYGFPIVAKLDWYIFHAIAIDFLWILLLTFPLLAAGLVWGKRGWVTWLFWMYVVLHSLVLLGTVVNHETYRFLGGHLNFNLLGTFGNKTSINEVFNYVAQDQTWRYFPYVLFYSSIPCSLIFFWLISKWFTSRMKTSMAVFLMGILCWAYPNIWGGGFREKKLAPLVSLIMENILKEKPRPYSESEIGGLVERYQELWTEEQGDSGWIFISDSLPYQRTSLFNFCSNSEDRQVTRCLEDRDKDGFAAAHDCDDDHSDIYPGAEDRVSNGLDEDCSGADSLPWNFVLVFLESHRAVNAGYLKPYGSVADGTPVLDSLAPNAHIWTRFNVSGIPTVQALVSTHLSILPHPNYYIATAFPMLKQKAFTVILEEHGYRTHFFSSADPSWDNQTPWLRQWYQGYSYHRSREHDADMFRHMSEWMKDSLNDQRPFFMTAITKTNHYPFNTVKGMAPHGKEDGLPDRMIKTMTYTEKALGALINSLKGETWFSRTLFIIMADHGFSLGAHNNANIGWGLYSEHTWIPFLILGDHPLLGPPDVHTYPADQADIGPTVLELAGIRAENHFTGHNLLRPGADSLNRSVTIRQEQGLVEAGSFRVHASLGIEPRRQGKEMFNGVNDRKELFNILEQYPVLFDSLSADLRVYSALNTFLLENNLIW
ncbi:LTA synthase family protein [Fibrobacterota bacterium]